MSRRVKKKVGFGPDSMTFVHLPKTIVRAVLKVSDAHPHHKVESFCEGHNWHIFAGKDADLRYVVREADGELLGVEHFIKDTDGDWEFIDVDPDTWRELETTS